MISPLDEGVLFEEEVSNLTHIHLGFSSSTNAELSGAF